MTAGTLESHCDGGVCRCDGVTGACPCREHVVGHSCDQCAPNHWNYGRGAGCEACGCQPTHALGPHCNMVGEGDTRRDMHAHAPPTRTQEGICTHCANTQTCARRRTLRQACTHRHTLAQARTHRRTQTFT